MKPTCFGCIHLKYQGPEAGLPPEEIDEEAGTYRCRMFSEILAKGPETPRPLLTACKEKL